MPTCGRPRTRPARRSSPCTVARAPTPTPPLKPSRWMTSGACRGGGDAAVTLHHVLIHVIAETQRHAGHADIVRELIDGAAGLLPRNDNLPPVDDSWWLDYRQRVEQ